jgi:hypothetical protein
MAIQYYIESLDGSQGSQIQLLSNTSLGAQEPQLFYIRASDPTEMYVDKAFFGIRGVYNDDSVWYNTDLEQWENDESIGVNSSVSLPSIISKVEFQNVDFNGEQKVKVEVYLNPNYTPSFDEVIYLDIDGDAQINLGNSCNTHSNVIPTYPNNAVQLNVKLVGSITLDPLYENNGIFYTTPVGYKGVSATTESGTYTWETEDQDNTLQGNWSRFTFGASASSVLPTPPANPSLGQPAEKHFGFLANPVTNCPVCTDTPISGTADHAGLPYSEWYGNAEYFNWNGNNTQRLFYAFNTSQYANGMAWRTAFGTETGRYVDAHNGECTFEPTAVGPNRTISRLNLSVPIFDDGEIKYHTEELIHKNLCEDEYGYTKFYINGGDVASSAYNIVEDATIKTGVPIAADDNSCTYIGEADIINKRYPNVFFNDYLGNNCSNSKAGVWVQCTKYVKPKVYLKSDPTSPVEGVLSAIRVCDWLPTSGNGIIADGTDQVPEEVVEPGELPNLTNTQRMMGGFENPNYLLTIDSSPGFNPFFSLKEQILDSNGRMTNETLDSLDGALTPMDWYGNRVFVRLDWDPSFQFPVNSEDYFIVIEGVAMDLETSDEGTDEIDIEISIDNEG